MDVVGGGDLAHGAEVVVDHFEGGGAGIAGDVVYAGEDDDCGGVEVDDVLTEADEHLWRGLAADAAVEVGLSGEEGAAVAGPGVGDGVAVKDYAVGFGGGEGGVVGGVAVELGPVWDAARGGCWGGYGRGCGRGW